MGAMQALSLSHLITRVTQAALRRPWQFFFGAAILTVVSVWLSLGLEIRSSFEELLPPNLPSVVHIKELLRRVGGEGTVLVTVENLDSAADISGAEAFASKLAEEYRKLGPSVIRSVESNVGPSESWYADHWPLFVSLEDLKKADEDVRKAVADAKAKANPLLLHLDDDDSAKPVPSKDLGPWGDPNTPLPREKVAEQFRGHPGGFFVHPDGRSVTIMVRPAGSALGVKEARQVLDRMRVVADGLAGELRANHLRVGFGGSYAILVAEYEAIVQSIGSTALLVASLVLLSLFLFFRDLRSTLALGMAMLVAVAVTFAVTRLVIGHLNTQTAFLWAIVLGNGINYGVIYLARERQLRRTGMPLGPAAIEGAQTAASATLLASAASSVSFGVLMIAANRGFRDFGFIGAVGMLLSWVSTFTLLPALLTIFEKFRPLRPVARREEDGHSKWAPVLRKLSQRPGVVVGIFGALTLLSAVEFIRFLPDAMERNLENVTNELKATNEVARYNARGQESIGMSIEGAIALLPSPQAADEFCQVIRHRQLEPRWKPLLDRCETISSVIPADQEQKLAVISSIRRRMSDLLLDSVDPKQRDRLRQVREDLAAQRTVTAAEAPNVLVDPFREQDGTLGRIATVTASHSAKLELADNLDAFVQAVRNVPVEGKLYEAAGEDVVVADLLRDIATEGPRTSFLSLAGVCVLVLLFFRASRDSVFVLGTLLTGVILMGGMAVLLHLKINFFNFIVFPITFGIAVDYGANVVSRIRERGGRVLSSLREVGPAVALCSWTSIIGYASLLPSVNRALRSFGLYAVAGEVASIVCALVLLPALKLMISPPVRAPVPQPHVAAKPFLDPGHQSN
jgi:predicted RND superfamily exporter protein